MKKAEFLSRIGLPCLSICLFGLVSFCGCGEPETQAKSERIPNVPASTRGADATPAKGSPVDKAGGVSKPK